MLSDEEKEIFNNLKDYMQSNIDNGYHKFIYNDLGWDFKCIDCINAIDNVLNLIEKQSKEIEHQKEKRENQKQELAILNAKQIEFNKLVNTVNSYKGQFKKQQKEIEELEMQNWIMRNVDKQYISIDKIKAKIEETENMNLYQIIEKIEISEKASLEVFSGVKKGILYGLRSLLEKE